MGGGITFTFRSDHFPVIAGEDAETNPFCYGKSLAEWIRARFAELGYRPESVIPEDWGWCVMLSRDPFLLWVGCGNQRSELLESIPPTDKDKFVPDGEKLTWVCFVGHDVPMWTKFYWRQLRGKVTTDEAVRKATRELERILRAEPRITDLGETPAG